MFNSFGNMVRLTSFGESHGKGIGGVLDGFPSGITIDMDFIQSELNRRRPGQSDITTARQEKDEVEFLSGIFEGKSTGCPIGFIVWNRNQRYSDYSEMQSVYRPSHADYTYKQKYGIRDYRGGGRSSARETIARVVAGALAKLALKQLGIRITAYTSQVGAIRLEENYTAYDLSLAESNPVRCPDPAKAKEMEDYILKVKEEGDTIGGVVTCVITGCPVGLGHQSFRIWRWFQRTETERLGAERRFLQQRRAHHYPYQPFRRYTGRHQQRAGHLFPCSLQTGGYGVDGTAYGEYRRKRYNFESAWPSRPMCVAPCSAYCGSNGSSDHFGFLFNR